MSGGVDSSVARFLLKKEGCEVIGITMQLWPKGLCGKHAEKKLLFARGDRGRAHGRAQLDIPHYVMNLEKEFSEAVIGYFCSEYEKGRTPNPCVVCNSKIKIR